MEADVQPELDSGEEQRFFHRTNIRGMTTTQVQKARAFRALHERSGAFIIPNPWDAGTAKLLAALGFEALATTSLGVSSSLGRRDGAGAVSRRECSTTAPRSPARPTCR